MRIEDKSDNNPRVIWPNTIGSLEGPQIFRQGEKKIFGKLHILGSEILGM